MKQIIKILQIIDIDVKKHTVVFLFDDYKIKKFDFKKLSEDKYKKKILNTDVFKTMTIEHGGLTFKHKSLKDDFGYYAIGGDTLYYKGNNVVLPSNDLIRIYRKVKNVSQKKLAEKLKVPILELQRVEQGKETDLKLISRILSVLI